MATAPPRRRAGSRRRGGHGGPSRSAAKDTLEHYLRFSSTLTLVDDETGEDIPFEVADWQRDVVADYFAGYWETLAEVPSGSGKTTLYGTVALHHGTYVRRDCRALILSASGKQARQMYEACAGFVTRSKDLRRWWVPQEYGLGRIKSLTDRGLIEIVSNAPKVSEGEIPTLVLPDEIHRMPDDGRAYSILISKLQKKGARVLGASTAGDDEESFLGRKRNDALTAPGMLVEGHLVPELRARGDEVRSTLGRESVRDGEYYTVARAADKTTAWHEWSLPEGVDPEDLDEVKRCNPSPFVTKHNLAMTLKLLRARPWDWLRQHCNRWALGENAAISSEGWGKNADKTLDVEVLAAYPKWVALDMGGVSDSTAIIPVWRLPDDPETGEPSFVTARGRIVWPPGEGEWTLVEDVVGALDEVVDLPGEFQGLVFDQARGGGYVAQMLQKQRPKIKIIDHGQAAEMDDASQLLARVVVEDRITHDGNLEVDRQVLAAAVKKSRRNRWYLAKPASQPHRKIDAAVALAMAIRVANAGPKQKRKIKALTPRSKERS